MVVQNYALFPHMRAEENVAFGLRARGAERRLVRERVPECLRLVGMEAYAKRYPRELSGGQQQRVAIARALAIRPQVLLLDEPLSALDAQIRRSMLDELARLHRDLPSLTVLYVTHDQTEALTLADHIGIMRDGKLVAFGAVAKRSTDTRRTASRRSSSAAPISCRSARCSRRAPASRRCASATPCSCRDEPASPAAGRRLPSLRASARLAPAGGGRRRQRLDRHRRKRPMARRHAQHRARRARPAAALHLHAARRAAGTGDEARPCVSMRPTSLSSRRAQGG